MREVTDKPIVEIRSFTSRLPVRAGSGLMITPLVDMIFISMIFFILGSSFVDLPGHQITTPDVDYEKFKTVPKKVLTVNSSSKIYFDDRPVPTFHELKNILSKFSDRPREVKPVIILRADENANYADITQIMSICYHFKIQLFVVTQ